MLKEFIVLRWEVEMIEVGLNGPGFKKNCVISTEKLNTIKLKSNEVRTIFLLLLSNVKRTFLSQCF